jgi:hypothetical protein
MPRDGVEYVSPTGVISVTLWRSSELADAQAEWMRQGWDVTVFDGKTTTTRESIADLLAGASGFSVPDDWDGIAEAIGQLPGSPGGQGHVLAVTSPLQFLQVGQAGDFDAWLTATESGAQSFESRTGTPLRVMVLCRDIEVATSRSRWLHSGGGRVEARAIAPGLFSLVVDTRTHAVISSAIKLCLRTRSVDELQGLLGVEPEGALILVSRLFEAERLAASEGIEWLITIDRPRGEFMRPFGDPREFAVEFGSDGAVWWLSRSRMTFLSSCLALVAQPQTSTYLVGANAAELRSLAMTLLQAAGEVPLDSGHPTSTGEDAGPAGAAVESLVPSLLKVDPEGWLLPAELTARDVDNLVASLALRGVSVRKLRGERMRTQDDLFHEAVAALQFPNYFGWNKDAFDECISDLEWIPPGSGYVLVITSPEEVLVDATPRDRAWFAESLRNAAERFAVADHGPPPRGPVAFHVVLASRLGADVVGAEWRLDPRS